MTWKKRQDHVMDGDICEPSEWRINNNEFASEFNGFLDSDNIREESIGNSQVKRDTFTRVLINQGFMGYDYLFSHKRSGFSSSPDYQFVAIDHDLSPLGHNSEFFGVANLFNQTTGLHFFNKPLPEVMASLGGMGPPLTAFSSGYGGDFASKKDVDMFSACYSKASQSDPKRECRLPYFKFRTEGDSLLIVDLCGTVQQHHMFSLNSAEDFFNWLAMKLGGMGAATSIIGRDGIAHISSMGYPYKVNKNGKMPEKNALILCSVWRILVDGNELCSTGMIGPELEAQPIYLNGAIPVSSGEHTVELQGKTCWYCPTTGKELPGSSINSSVTWTPSLDGGVNAIFSGAPNTYDGGGPHPVKEYIRKDISLRQPNMVVQIRSR